MWDTYANAPMMLPCGKYSHTKNLAGPKLASKMPEQDCTAQPTWVEPFQTTWVKWDA